jgi:hypothetical protein
LIKNDSIGSFDGQPAPPFRWQQGSGACFIKNFG